MPPRALLGKDDSKVLDILAENSEGCTDKILQQKVNFCFYWLYHIFSNKLGSDGEKYAA